MKNEVYLIRGSSASVKTTFSRMLYKGKTCVHITNGLCEKIKVEDFKNFLDGENDAIIFEEVLPSHIKRIKFIIDIFRSSIKYSPVFIITTQILNLNFKGVDHYITIE